MCGLEVASRAHQAGFTCIYLATGEPPRDLMHQYPFLKGVIGKEFPSDHATRLKS